MSCPKCGAPLDMDPEGGWCDKCQEYWPEDILEERRLEEDPDREEDQ